MQAASLLFYLRVTEACAVNLSGLYIVCSSDECTTGNSALYRPLRWVVLVWRSIIGPGRCEECKCPHVLCTRGVGDRGKERRLAEVALRAWETAVVVALSTGLTRVLEQAICAYRFA